MPNFNHLNHLSNADIRDMRDKLFAQGFHIAAMDLNNYLYLRPSADVFAQNYDDDQLI